MIVGHFTKGYINFFVSGSKFSRQHQFILISTMWECSKFSLHISYLKQMGIVIPETGHSLMHTYYERNFVHKQSQEKNVSGTIMSTKTHPRSTIFSL